MGDNKPRTEGSALLKEESPESLDSFRHIEEQHKNSWEKLRKSGRRKLKSHSMSALDDKLHRSDNPRNSLPHHLVDRRNMEGTRSSLKGSGFMTEDSCLSSPDENLESFRNREEQNRNSDSPRRRLSSREQRLFLEKSRESEKKKKELISQEDQSFLDISEESEEIKEKEKKSWYQKSVKTLLWLILGSMVLVFIIIAVLLSVKCCSAGTDRSSFGPPCEKSWIWVDGRCYYFSNIKKTWNDSRDFCTRHGSTLAVLMDQEIKKTIERYGENLDYWIGLSMDHNGRWMWTDGSLYNGSVANQDSQHLRCAFLNSHLGALACSTSRQWICVQDSA